MENKYQVELDASIRKVEVKDGEINFQDDLEEVYNLEGYEQDAYGFYTGKEELIENVISFDIDDVKEFEKGDERSVFEVTVDFYDEDTPYIEDALKTSVYYSKSVYKVFKQINDDVTELSNQINF